MPPSPERAAAPAADQESRHSEHHPGEASHDEGASFKKPKDREGKSASPKEGGQLESLNEGQLRALLDEAVTYKRPKDREGKSLLFNNLLHQVEQDEYLHGRTGLCVSSGGGTNGKRGRSKRLTTFPHSGSLQDLANAGVTPDPRAARHQARQRRTVPVSQRSYHGGSLPANVDQNFGAIENRHSFLEDVRNRREDEIPVSGGDYIATVRCVNPPLLTSNSSEFMYMNRLVTTSENERVPSPSADPTTSGSPLSSYPGYLEDCGTEMEIISSKKISHQPSYTTRATLEIGSSSMTGESAVDKSIGFSLVDSNHGCISSPGISQPPPTSVSETKPLQLASTYNAVKSITDGMSIGSMTSSGYTISNPSLSGHSLQDPDKVFDENYNTVQTVNAITAAGQPSKKQFRRKKFSKNETEILAEQIDGYRGDETDIKILLKFIESDAENLKQQNKYQSKSNSDVGINGKMSNCDKGKDENESDKTNKKRSTERKMKDSKADSKIKRANSMEELSHRKLDDLTSSSTKDSSLGASRKSKKSANYDQSDVSSAKNSERRSWCNDESDNFFKTDNNTVQYLSEKPLEHTVTNPNVKTKEKPAVAEIDLSNVNYDQACNVEASDFQTVTKKKKIRRKQSPGGDSRSRNNNFYNDNFHGHKMIAGGRSVQDRENFYKRIGHTSRPSASSPPSDKSNDSNDDLDSIHSLPADASGERLQASYADMARSAPTVSPPPPITTVARAHNFPDLIESCNYYSNDVSIQDKHLDISVENTKNLLLKTNHSPESEKSSVLKTNCPDVSSQFDHKAYVREQYPALDFRHKTERGVVKSKADGKFTNNYNKQVSQNSERFSDKRVNAKVGSKHSKEEYDNLSVNSSNEVNSNDNYFGFTKLNSANTNNNNIIFNSVTEPYQNLKINKYCYPPLKVESSMNKPPDVVLPVTIMTQMIPKELSQAPDSGAVNRPPVIIMNEESTKPTLNVHNVNSITFGFDINEQLINGDDTSFVLSKDTSLEESSFDSQSVKLNDTASTVNLSYNSDVDFPAINERPFREYERYRNDDAKHPKKPNRFPGRDIGAKGGHKNSVSTSSDDSSYSKRNDINDNRPEEKQELGVQECSFVETKIGQDKSLRYLTPTTTSKDIYNLNKIVNYVGLAWEDIIKSPGDKVRYFSEQQ